MSIEETIFEAVRKAVEPLEKKIEQLESRNVEVNQEVPQTITVAEAAKLAGFGKTKVYDMIERYEETGIPFIKHGNRIRIPYQTFLAWINNQQQAM